MIIRKITLRYLAVCFVIFGLSYLADTQSEPGSAATRRNHPAARVKLAHVEASPVQGQSWLEHLGRRMNESSMGSMGVTGILGPSAPQEAAPFKPLGSSFLVSGADLYRLSCRGCHGDHGEGVPPEINSMIDPIRATSADLILERMKKVGAPISGGVARQLASQSEDALLQRIHNGGQNMPGFPQLSRREVQALVTYLDLLAGIRNAENKQMTIEIPVDHVGEDLVKGTCHICHAATGSNPRPEEIMAGAIPPLGVLTQRLDEQQFVQKVTAGRPIVMGDLHIQYRGRMPVFSYLTPDQAAAAYLYLERYPPGATLNSRRIP